MDPHDNRREAQKRWEEAFREAQTERAKNPTPPLQYGLPPPSQLFDLEPVCVIPKYIRGPAPIQQLGEPGERRFFQ